MVILVSIVAGFTDCLECTILRLRIAKSLLVTCQNKWSLLLLQLWLLSKVWC